MDLLDLRATTLVLALLPVVFSSSSNAKPVFPSAMHYIADMRMKDDNSSYYGVHSFNSDPSKQYTHIQWSIRSSDPRVPPVFTLMALGNKQLLYQIFPDDAQPTLPACYYMDWKQAVFNYSWNVNAVYQGVVWYGPKLCKKWSNTVPFVIQGEVRVCDFYSDFFTDAPVAFDNPVSVLNYTGWPDPIEAALPDEAYTRIATGDLKCQPAATVRWLGNGAIPWLS